MNRPPRLVLSTLALSFLIGCGGDDAGPLPDAGGASDGPAPDAVEVPQAADASSSADGDASPADAAARPADAGTTPDLPPASPDAPPEAQPRCTLDRVVEARRYRGTGDAPIFNARLEYRRMPGLVLEIMYRHPGPDLRWGTEDDEVLQYWRTKITGSTGVGEPIVHPGNDGVWLTADDSTDGRIACSTYDTAGRQLTLLETYGTPGDDGKPCSNDESSYHGYRHEYGADGREERAITLKFPGPDNRWFTPDDKVEYWIRYVHADDGSVKELQMASSPGADGMWLTPDDPLKPAAIRTYVGSDRYYDQHVLDPASPEGIYYYCVRPPSP